jgi:hypothetical protein
VKKPAAMQNKQYDNNPEDFSRLEAVASKSKEWANLAVSTKLELLEELIKTMTTMGFEPHKELGEEAAISMGIPPTTDEGRYESRLQTIIFVSTVKNHLSGLQQAYKIRNGERPPKGVSDLEIRKAINGQICVKTFPVLSQDKMGPMGSSSGEVWMDPEFVKEKEDVKPFSFESFESGGLMVVLGAGNQGMLEVNDVLYGLFVRNCVVYLKHHQQRAYMDTMTSALFATLIKRGYFDAELHTTVERSAALVSHPSVAAVHLTGGKQTHDAIVWGNDIKERASNLQKKTPKLKATMTSELGAVSPWIVVPGEYTEKELQAQVKMIAFWIHNNASCNCNAPKVVVLSDWPQKDRLLQIVESELTGHSLPVAYYTGIKERWTNYQMEYPEAKLLHSKSGLGIEERELFAPAVSKEPCLLPYIQIEIDVDLTSVQGRKAAQNEYAFLTEPFAPVYTIATLKGTDSLGSFCSTASTFCNNFLFGSLSGSVTVPPALLSSGEVQQLIADLKYGGIGVNAWGGSTYGAVTGGWGAFPGESLNNVESGIGRIHNVLFLPHFQKFVLTCPIISPAHNSLKADWRKEGNLMEAVGKFILHPGFSSLIGILSAVTGIDLIKTASVIFVAAVAIGTFKSSGLSS